MITPEAIRAISVYNRPRLVITRRPVILLSRWGERRGYRTTCVVVAGGHVLHRAEYAD